MHRPCVRARLASWMIRQQCPLGARFERLFDSDDWQDVVRLIVRASRTDTRLERQLRERFAGWLVE